MPCRDHSLCKAANAECAFDERQPGSVGGPAPAPVDLARMLALWHAIKPGDKFNRAPETLHASIHDAVKFTNGPTRTARVRFLRDLFGGDLPQPAAPTTKTSGVLTVTTIGTGDHRLVTIEIAGIEGIRAAQKTVLFGDQLVGDLAKLLSEITA